MLARLLLNAKQLVDKTNYEVGEGYRAVFKLEVNPGSEGLQDIPVESVPDSCVRFLTNRNGVVAYNAQDISEPTLLPGVSYSVLKTRRIHERSVTGQGNDCSALGIWTPEPCADIVFGINPGAQGHTLGWHPGVAAAESHCGCADSALPSLRGCQCRLAMS
ncbi:hypothetical protein FGB62_373g09 [Gracilaria domingensis]|nr:hypothetical protein FGB62_373g09 [Gracilaria domingensis]